MEDSKAPGNTNASANANSKKINKASLAANIGLALLIPALLGYHYLTHPFASELAKRSISLSSYSREHRQNFNSALSSLDGAVIKPHSTFSFNNRLGDRTTANGYVPAASYYGGQSVASNGGGICLISSTLYQLALLSGMEVLERTPHVETVASVPPGLDATVWYGIHDLKLKNPYDYPLEIATSIDSTGNQATIKILGKAGLTPVKRSIERREVARDRKTLLVEVYLEDGPKSRLLSRDSYRLRRP